ncbi:MAG: endonuclease V, partial [Sporichthyaceae bacterium]|nr:endonuclease V [Sporichthyaceae bacterium]
GLVVAGDRRFGTLVEEHVAWVDHVASYQPGRFFTRELPPIMAVLSVAGTLDLLIIDGYVDLDPAGRPGLGAHLHQALAVPIIGVAKTAFRTASHAVAVRRGRAARPLYVTAAGIPIEQAASLVAALSGPHRIPHALRRADRLARGDQPHR